MLLIDILHEDSGPDFLVHFLMWSTAVLTVLAAARWWNGEPEPAAPEPRALEALHDPYLAAVLRGGLSEAVLCAAAFLDRRSLLKLERDKVSAPEGHGTPDLHPLEAAVLAAAAKGPAAYELADEVADGKAGGGYGEAAEAKLRSLGLLVDAQGAWAERRWLWAGFALIHGPGVYRLVRGILRGRPVLFLVIEMALFAFALLLALKPRRHTQAGTAALESLKERYSFLDQAARRAMTMVPSDELLALALFGTGAGALGTEAQRLQDLFRPPASSSSSCGGSCGGGCGGGGCGGGGCGG